MRRGLGALLSVTVAMLAASGAASPRTPGPPIRYVGCLANDQEHGCAPLPEHPVGDRLGGVAISPDGSSLYAVSDYGALMSFSRDASGGLTYAGCFANLGDDGCTTPTYNSILDPQAVAVSPDGGQVYVVSDQDASITTFDRSPDGSLTYAGCIADRGEHGCEAPAHPSLVDPTALTISPDGRSVYVVSDLGSLSRFDRAPDGSLTYLGCFANRGYYGCKQPKPNTLGFAVGVTVSPDGRSVYVTNYSDAIIIFHRRANGALASRGCIADKLGSKVCPYRTGHYALYFDENITPSADGRFVYVTGDDMLSAFRRHQDGTLTLSQCFRTEGQNGCEAPGHAVTKGASGLAVSADGRYVYMATDGTDYGSILAFAVSRQGRLSYLRCASRYKRNGCRAVIHDSFVNPFSLAVSPDGTSLYAGTDDVSNSLVQFALTPDESVAERHTEEPDSISYWDPDHAVLGTGNAYRVGGGTVQLSDDGGQTFRTVLQTPRAVVWVDTAGTEDAWAVLEKRRKPPRLLRSQDGGQTWQRLPDSPATDPSFATPNDGRAAAFVRSAWHVLATHNGGATWSSLRGPCPDAEDFAVSLATKDDAWAACGDESGTGNQRKRIFASTDGGHRWHQLAVHDLSSICCISALNFSPSGAGILFDGWTELTGDGGRHWSGFDSPDGGAAFSGQWFTPSDGALLDYEHLVATHDSGRTWTLVHRFGSP